MEIFCRTGSVRKFLDLILSDLARTINFRAKHSRVFPLRIYFTHPSNSKAPFFFFSPCPDCAVNHYRMTESDTFLHLARPLGPAPTGAQPSTAPLNVIIQPQVRYNETIELQGVNADQELNRPYSPSSTTLYDGMSTRLA